MLGWFSRVASCASSTNMERKRRDAPCAGRMRLTTRSLNVPLGPALLGQEDLGHPPRPEAVEDLEISELDGSLAIPWGGGRSRPHRGRRDEARHGSVPAASSGENMALRRCSFRRLPLLSAVVVAAAALLTVGPALAQPKQKPAGPIAPPTKKTDMELDPDAKPPEEKPLPPPEPASGASAARTRMVNSSPAPRRRRRRPPGTRSRRRRTSPRASAPIAPCPSTG